MVAGQATLKLPNGDKIELPIIPSSIGESAIDVSKLYKQTGLFSYDPGFMSTASCQSSITFIDGEKGILLHRGKTIADLCNNTTFSNVFFALLYGELPNETNSQNFTQKLVSQMQIEEEVKNVVLSFSKDMHPMAIMMGAISMLSAKHHSLYNPYNESTINDTSIDCVAKICTIGAFVFRYINNLSLDIKTDLNLSFEENLIKIMFEGTKSYQNPQDLLEAINKILILHADHEQNASTSSVKLVASTDVNIYASMAAGFAALWGPLHGGANEAVIKMLEEIKTVDKIPEFIEKAKDKNNPFRLMGFGHRVYKNYDPRATVLKSSCDKILKIMEDETGSEALKVAKELESIALKDPYFIQRKLFPNVDFYSGIIYKALGMQSSFFTVVFGMARSAGWCSQVKESMLDEEKRISRPRQVYVGETQ